MRRRLGRGLIFISVLAIGVAACSDRVPAPVVYKGVFPKTALVVPPTQSPTGFSATAPSGVTRVVLRPPVTAPPPSKKLTLRSLIERNRLEVLLRFREPPVRRQKGVHTVAAGETAYGIARRYGVDVDRLARANGLDASYRIRPGQSLRLPEAKTGSVVVASLPKEGAGDEARAEPKLGLNQVLPPRAGSFRWPLRGELLMAYGPQPGGRHNDGINIGAPVGTPVVASEAGIVAYVGDDVDTLGNLVLIRHAGGWVTAYAHNESVGVTRGMRVARGDIIGRTGATGNVDRPQLHFQIRKETEAVDPIGLLGSQTAARGRR